MFGEKDAAAPATATEEFAILGRDGDGAPKNAKRRGRRPSHDGRWTKVTVVLLDRQIVFLDRLVADIRASSGGSISRAHLIRALIDALAESDIDLTNHHTERDLKHILATRLGRGWST